MLKIIHITDLHFVPAGNMYQGLNPAERLRSVLGHINEYHANAEAILITGDLANEGSAEAYELLKDVLSEVAIPTHLMIGNHDNREAFQQVFGGEGFVQKVLDIHDWRAILLDSKDETGHQGLLDNSRLEWLDTQLSESSKRPVLLAVHHTPHNLHQPFFTRTNLKNSKKFLDIVKSYGNVRHMICGHRHLASAGSFAGIPFTISRGITSHITIDFEQYGKPEVYAAAPSYDVVCLEDEHVVVHCQAGFHNYPIISAGSPKTSPITVQDSGQGIR